MYESLYPPGGADAPLSAAEQMMKAMQLSHDNAAALAAGDELLDASWSADGISHEELVVGFRFDELDLQTPR